MKRTTILRYRHGTNLSANRALLSLLHPRLLTSLVMIEPVLEKDLHTGHGASFAKVTLPRKTAWSSHDEAVRYFKKVHKKWDPRAHDLWIEHGLREILPGEHTSKTPLESSPVVSKPLITLTTLPEQEAVFYVRPNFDRKKPASGDASHPDIIGPPHAIYPFYRYEPILAWNLLRHIRPPVLYLFGEKSPFSSPQGREEKLERTGSGIGGNGGHERDRKSVV